MTTTTASSETALRLPLENIGVQTLGIKSTAYLDNVLSILTNENATNHIRYIWSHDAKEVCILIRDAILELLKLEQYQKDGLRNEYDVLSFHNNVIHTLTLATEELNEKLVAYTNPSTSDSPEWIHQTDPSSLIVKQITELRNQIKKIQRSQHKLNQLVPKFQDYRELYAHSINQRITRFALIQTKLQQLTDSVANADNDLSNEQAIAAMELLDQTISEFRAFPQLSSYEYITLEDVNKLKVPVDTDGGILRYKSIDILSEVNGWSSLNLTSDLRSIELSLESFCGKVLLVLQQLSNKLKARVDENGTIQEVKKAVITTPIGKLLEIYEQEITPDSIEKLHSLNKEIDSYIRVSGVFNNEYDFLPFSTLEQLSSIGDTNRFGQIKILEDARKKFNEFFNTTRTKYFDTEQLTASGFVEKLICFDPQADSNLLFLRRGYLGASFTIDRTDIEQRIDQHVRLWQQGYGGGLLVKGGHNTGKSTVVEKLPLMYENIQSYHFVIGQKIDVDGQVMIVNNDLISALKFVVAHHTAPCMVTIDNFDQYTNNPEATFLLVDSLMEIVQKHSKTIYFVVSMHSYLYEHLKQYFSLNHAFTEVIDTDVMSSADIEEAVLIRASAVANNHDILNQSDESISNAKKIVQHAHNNVGRAMQLWCMYQAGFTDMKGISEFKKIILANASLIRIVTKHGETLERSLRSMLNELDAVRLKEKIASLVSTRILLRPKEGHIAINPYLRTTIELIINKKI